MAQIDERVVAMSFETAKFDAGVQKTLDGLKTLSDSLNNINKLQGLDQLEKSSQKVTLQAPMSALDRLKAKLGMTTAGTTFSDMERSADQVKLQGPQSALDRLKAKLSFTNSGTTFSDMERSANQVKLQGPQSALDRLKAKLGFTNAGSTFSDMERSADRVKLQGPQTALDRLKTKLGQTNAESTFSDMERSADRVTLAGLSRAVSNAGSQFSILQGAAAVALGNIASQAISAGANLAKSFTLGPITQGLGDYETQINAVQTILANTGLTGAKGLGQVNSALDELNHYADKTIYNFSEMAKNIGTFTAAGVNLETATSSIKGIANLAAVSGSSAQQAAGAMYQLSQAIAVGKVNLMDWKSVETAGMGGKVFQKALFDTAKAMGTLKDVPVGQTFDEWKKAGNSFRQSLSATQKSATDGTAAIAKAQKDGAESVRNAQESAAESIQSAKDRVTDAQKRVAEAHKQTAEAVQAANDRVKEAEAGVAETAERSAEAIKNAQDGVKEAEAGVAEASKKSAEAIKNAQDEVKEAHKKVAEEARKSAEAIKNAQDGVKEAQAGVAKAAKDSAANIESAVKAQADAVKQSAENVQSALDGVTDAQKRLAEAMKPASADELESATDSLKTAQLDQADLAGAISDAQREQKRSTEDLAAAQAKLADLRRSGADPTEIASAQRAVEDATRRAADASDAQERALLRQHAAARSVTKAQEDLTAAQKKGTDEDENVKNSQDALSQALKRYSDAQVNARETVIAAEQRVADARENGVTQQEEASKKLIDAEKQVSEARKNGAERAKEVAKELVDAEKRVTDARKDGVEQQRDAAKKLIDAENRVVDARKNSVKDQRDASKKLVDAENDVVDARQNGAERATEAAQAVVDAQKAEVKATQKAQEQIAKAHEQAAASIQAAKDKAKPDTGPTSWLTSDVLTNTLKQFTGDMTTAQLKAQGFTDEQIKAIQATGRVAVESATKIKTLSQLTSTLKEEVGSAWSAIFETLFGSIDKSTALFTGMDKALQKVFVAPVNDLGKLLAEWDKLGGRKDLFAGVKAGVDDLKAVFQPLKDAFREIFPPKTAQDLITLTGHFRDLMESLKIGPDTADNLRRIFAGLFAVLDIGWTIVKRIVGVIADLLGEAGKGSGGILDFAGSIGDFLVKVDEAIKSGDGLNKFFEGLTAILKVPIHFIGVLVGAISGLFGFSDSKGLEGTLQGVNDKLGPLDKVVDSVSRGFKSLQGFLGGVKTALDPWFAQMADNLSAVGDIIENAFTGLDYNKLMSGLQTGLLAGILFSIKKAFSNNSIVSFGKPFEGINRVLGGFTGQMEAMQSKLHAEALLAIAGAVAVLAAGIFILSKIPADELTKAMTAVSVGLAELMGAMKLMTSGIGKLGILQLPAIAISLIGLAAAVVILSLAMKIFATMSWEDIAKGMAGVAGSLTAIAGAMKLMGGGPTLVAQAAGLVLIGAALNLIAGAMKIFATMKWEDIAKGVFAVAEALGMIALGMSMMPPTLPITAAGLVLVAVALNGIGLALKIFAGIDFISMLKGLAGIGGALVTIALAVGLFPPTMPITAAGLVIMGAALTTIAGAIALMGNLKLETLVKGIAAMGASLVVLAFGLELMAGTGLGALGLMAAASALALLAPTLGYLGTLDISTIIIGLTAMAATIVVVGLASEVAAPGLIELGFALIPLGVALVLAAGAVYLFAKALSLVGDVGPKAVAVLIAAMTAFVMALPDIIIKLLKGLLDIVDQIAVLAPKVVVALGVIIDTIIAFVIASAPKLAIAIGVLIDSFLTVLVENTPKIIAAGFKLLLDFLSGLSSNIGKVTETVASIIVNYLNALSDNLPKIIAAGAHLLVVFIGGIASKVASLVAAVANFIISFVTAVGDNIGKVTAAGAHLMVKFIEAIAGYLGTILDKGTEAVLKFLSGVASTVEKVIDKGVEIAGKFINGIAKGLVKLTNTGADAIIDFLNGMAEAIRTKGPEIRAAGWNVANALIDGIWDGIHELGHFVVDKLGALIDLLPGAAKKILGISSPSSVFAEIGKNTMEGMVQGFAGSSGAVVSAAEGTADDVVSAMRNSLQSIPDLVNGMIDVDPTITPVLDLSNVEQGAKKLGDLTNVVPITAAASFGQAAAISAAQAAAATAPADQAAQAGNTFEFNQYNTSPKSLSEIEIYRQTNNQLSQLKSAVGIP